MRINRRAVPGTAAPRRALRLAVVGCVLLAFGLLGSGTALAHNALTGSAPADGSSIAESPTTVTLTFNDVVQNLQPLITVSGPDGSRWEGSPISVLNNTVSVPVHQLGPIGAYTVAYRIISADGHPVEGTTTFNLTVAGAGVPNPVAAETASRSNDIPAWVWILGAGLVLLAVVIGGVVTARRRASS